MEKWIISRCFTYFSLRNYSMSPKLESLDVATFKDLSPCRWGFDQLVMMIIGIFWDWDEHMCDSIDE